MIPLVLLRYRQSSLFCAASLLLAMGGAALAAPPVATASEPVARDASVPEAERYWPQWRGPLATGVAPHADPPIAWSEDRNLRWKVELPGKGHSSPVVWGNRVFVTGARPVGPALPPRFDDAPGVHDSVPVTREHEFLALAVDRGSGKVVWERVLRRVVPHEGGHVTGSLASSSPATDGERVYVFFGSRGLYALDFDGVVVWHSDLGQMSTLHAHGEGSSPVLFGDTLVVNWDHEGQSFVVALDKRTGKERWRALRDEVTSWASPIVVMVSGRPQLVVSGTKRVRGYDLATGRVIWECGGLSSNVVATPVAGGGLVFAGSSYDTTRLMAIRLEGARGDITGTPQVVWSRERGTPYVPSPLLYEGSLYFLRHYQGIMTRVVAATGDEPNGPFRLPGLREIYASPVAAAGRIYVSDRSGSTLVITTDVEPKVVAVNELDDSFSASAALAGRELFLKGERYLYSLAGSGANESPTPTIGKN